MRQHELLGLEQPKFILPVSPGRNVATLIETAVRAFLIRVCGADRLDELVKKHTAAVSGKR